MKILLFILAILSFQPVYAEELSTEELAEKLRAAKDYLAVIPIENDITESIEQLVVQVPVAERTLFRSILERNLRVKDLESFAERSLTEVFTAEELKALTAFYQTPEGAAVQQKMPDYQAKLQPYIRDQVKKSFEQFEAQK